MIRIILFHFLNPFLKLLFALLELFISPPFTTQMITAIKNSMSITTLHFS
nr:MAG TPA: hypothetical protein [Caudoviricetes sp.]